MNYSCLGILKFRFFIQLPVYLSLCEQCFQHNKLPNILPLEQWIVQPNATSFNSDVNLRFAAVMQDSEVTYVLRLQTKLFFAFSGLFHFVVFPSRCSKECKLRLLMLVALAGIPPQDYSGFFNLAGFGTDEKRLIDRVVALNPPTKQARPVSASFSWKALYNRSKVSMKEFMSSLRSVDGKPFVPKLQIYLEVFSSSSPPPFAQNLFYFIFAVLMHFFVVFWCQYRNSSLNDYRSRFSQASRFQCQLPQRHPALIGQHPAGKFNGLLFFFHLSFTSDIRTTQLKIAFVFFDQTESTQHGI
jgi:hypothetical protein